MINLVAVMKLKTFVYGATGVLVLVTFVLVIAWLLNTCFYLKFAHKKLKRLHQNCIDEFTVKLTRNAEFNFSKFKIVAIMLIIEICLLALPVINHGVFDRRFRREAETVCIEGCCLKNWTFAYDLERVGDWDFLSCLIDSCVFTAFYCEFWVFAILMQYSQLEFLEKEEEKKRLVRNLRWKTAIFLSLSLIVLTLLAIRQTILIGSILYPILTCACLPFVIKHYRKLKRMRRRHLVDLSYECYMDTCRVKNEVHTLKWIERGSEAVITIVSITILINTLEMIFSRIIGTLFINPCWLKINYSIDVNIQLPDSVKHRLAFVEQVTYLLRSVIIFALILALVVIHFAVLINKLVLRFKRKENSDLIKKLIEENNDEWHKCRLDD